MAAVEHFVFFSVCLAASLGSVTTSKDNTERSNVCTYFGENRRPSPQGNLVNCSWYSTNACCKRTEVTSVFGGMYPLRGANRECTNMVNYMMCYFCSPEQHKWFDKTVMICEDYCNLLFENCKNAQYQEIRLSSEYSSGVEFCKSQKFTTVGGSDCFNFDPDVFGTLALTMPSQIAVVTSYLFSVLSLEFTLL